MSVSAQVSDGVEIAPGVWFCEKLWSRLGQKTLEAEKQKRRDRMGDTRVVPDVPTSVFDHTFRSDAAWKQRELLLRKAYVNHLEDLTLQKDDEKDVMHKQVMQQVTGVYKLHENEAVKRLSAHTNELQGKMWKQPDTPNKCRMETAAAVQCYKANSQNPLECRKMVDALERCSALARQQALASLPPGK